MELTRVIPNNSVIFVPKGSAKKIISYINKNYNYKLNKLDPYILAHFGKINYGYLDLNVSNLPKIDFLKTLAHAKPKVINITLIPGETTVVFLKELAKDQNLSYDKLSNYLKKNAPFYEGFLVPNTYKFTKGDSEDDIMKKLITNSKLFHNKIKKEFLGNDINNTAYEKIITKASIIQKEAANSAEMPIISGVIDNRLAKGMKLQMDGTLNYGEFSHTKVTAKRLREDKSEFNTYLHTGLTPAPICVVSIDAIKAAINPDKNEYLYFFKPKNSKTHQFFKTYDEHFNSIKSSTDHNITDKDDQFLRN